MEVADAAGHTGRHIPARLAKHHSDPASHVLGAVIAQPLHPGGYAGVADTEPLANLAADEQLPRCRAVRDHVAGDDVVCCDESSSASGPNHNAATGKPLGQIVVAVTFQPQRDAGGEERAEALSRRAFEGDVDSAVRETFASSGLGYLVAQDRSNRAIDIPNRDRGANGLTGVQRRSADLDQLLVQRLSYPVILNCRVVQHRSLGKLWPVQDRPEIETVRLPVCFRPCRVEDLDVTDRLVDGPETQRCKVFPNFLRNELKEVDHELRLARELRTELGVLCRHAHRAGVEMADPHHDAAADHQRASPETEPPGPEQRADDHVTTGLQLAVDLPHDAVAEPVQQQRLLRLGQTELPRATGMLQGGQRGGTGTAVMSRDQYTIGLGLGT